MSIFILDGKYMTTRADAYSHIDKVMRMPEYFGKNLDALQDCLDELSDTIVIMVNSEVMLEALENYGNKMLKIFRNCEQITFIEK